MIRLESEKISAWTHGALVPVMTAGTVILALIAGKNIHLQVSTMIYGASAITLFAASFLYHAKKKSANERSFWRKLDKSAIYALIAGTYTPMCILYLEGDMMRGILAAQWILVLSGIFFSFFVPNAPRKISAIIYLMMGWLVVIPFKSMIAVMPLSVLALLVTGGTFYTAGALIYAFKKPDFSSFGFGFHEVFHLFVNAGAISHLIMIITGVYLYIKG